MIEKEKDPEVRGTRQQIMFQSMVYPDNRREEEYDPGTAEEMIAWLGRAIQSAPEEYRSAVRVKFRGGFLGLVTVYYDRPETDEEWAERKAEFKQEQEWKEYSERMQYKALRAKFGDEPPPRKRKKKVSA